MSADPHAFRGAHPTDDGVVIRAVRPAAQTVTVYVDDEEVGELRPADTDGLFEGEIKGVKLPLDYQLEVDYGEPGRTFRIEDPYRFTPTIGELDLHLAGEGRHEEIYARLGAHVMEHEGVEGTSFGVWAPAAQSVSVVGDLNGWDGRLHPMRALGSSGIWELFVPQVGEGTSYKYEITGPDGERFQKADPYAFQAEHPPKTASIVHEPKHEWRDGEWMQRRHESTPLTEPMSVYEVHLGSWRLNPLEDNRSLTYLELADELAAYAKDMGFTHLELLPVMHHPFSGSWGYQVTGYYAPSPRFGSPDDFREFVDRLHGHGLGVILDWVPAHFPRDEFALARFDGTALYEHADPRRGAHPDWGTLVFNYGRHEVRNFLLANALFWMREYHVDGIRVDAVASMLYLDYSRREGEWVPNEYGGREDLDAVAFLKELNEVLYGHEPGVVSAAEESTAWPGVSRPTYLGGLGFGFKWNMGWMHDTLAYFQNDPIYRRYPPPRADLLAGLRVHRELHPAAVARRGRARQGIADQQDARRRLAEAREPARALRLHVGASRQEAAVHGPGVRPVRGVEPRALARLAPAGEPGALGHPVARARPQPHLHATSRRCGSSTSRARASGGSSPTTRSPTSSPSGASRRAASACCCS